jgi:hypothetical protein
VRPTRTITAAALSCLALIGAGCGGDEEGDPIPAAQREQILSRLDEAERRLDDGSQGACMDILDDTEPEVDNVVASLPENVDADIRQRLEEGLQNLWDLVTAECEQLEGQETDTETTPEPPPPPPETETEEVPTVPEEEPEEEDDGGMPPGQGNEKGKGNDGGGGAGGGQGGIDLPGTGGGGTVAPGEG